LKRTSGRGRLALGDQKKIEIVTKSIFAILPNAAEEDHLHAEAAAARFFPADVGEWLEPRKTVAAALLVERWRDGEIENERHELRGRTRKCFVYRSHPSQVVT
jgi:hypothetical protein